MTKVITWIKNEDRGSYYGTYCTHSSPIAKDVLKVRLIEEARDIILFKRGELEDELAHLEKTLEAATMKLLKAAATTRTTRIKIRGYISNKKPSDLYPDD